MWSLYVIWECLNVYSCQIKVESLWERLRFTPFNVKHHFHDRTWLYLYRVCAVFTYNNTVNSLHKSAAHCIFAVIQLPVVLTFTKAYLSLMMFCVMNILIIQWLSFHVILTSEMNHSCVLLMHEHMTNILGQTRLCLEHTVKAQTWHLSTLIYGTFQIDWYHIGILIQLVYPQPTSGPSLNFADGWSRANARHFHLFIFLRQVVIISIIPQVK